MNPELAIDFFKSTVVFALYTVAPFLILTLIIGLATSLIQSVTSLQEQTLTFVPKLLGLSALILILTPWLLRSLTEFTITIITRMGSMGQ
ncbi:MAG TPA: flagellar biosynthetic protein FliQ [Opitutus sp.]|jgi:flagellar biosynthetic protein FliQ|nr:flagellar biosynthetic protein FliQ [Opitutus sp.]